MADLTRILGGPWSPPAERQPEPPEAQLRQAMVDAGLHPPDAIIIDGKLRRFASGTKGAGGQGSKPGWYVAFPDGIPAGRFGCWRSGVEATWRADTGRTPSPAEELALARRMAEAQAVRDAERARVQSAVADTVESIWAQAAPASADHPYLARKRVQPHGLRVTGDGRLVAPLIDADGVISSLQYIDHDGGKLYHPGGRAGGCSWCVGDPENPGPLYIAEGFATAATIHEATGQPCAVAYSASNLVAVAGQLRERHGKHRDLVVVADHDAHGVGQKYADQASARHGVRVIVPPLAGMDANDYMHAGHDLAALLSPPTSDWLVQADDFAARPAPIKWLIKRWIQDQALIMVHGPSGGGKTFVVLDMCMRIAANQPDWFGHPVRPGSIVYLAGEGHHGLRGRIAAWKHRHGVERLDMWLSRSGCDLNTPAGYAQARDAIRAMPIPPRVIVVDTLHRFLHGDENSAQDAKSMLDACAALMAEFGCTVILVHHTGVSEEAQHRARGSSAWRGALDIEISVVPSKGDCPLEIVQRKAKDAELAAPLYATLHSVTIPGWLDEDGEPVTSAVIEPAEAPPERPSAEATKRTKHLKMIEAAWWHSGAEERDGKPYLSRSGLMDYLTGPMEMAEAGARQVCKPSATGKPVAELMLAGVIEPHEHGWVLADLTVGSAWLMARSVK